MNITSSVTWYDPDTTDTIYIAAAEYGLTVLDVEVLGPTEILATVKGEESAVNKFTADVEEGDPDPFDTTAVMDDNDYQLWLKDRLEKLGKAYTPKVYTEEMT